MFKFKVIGFVMALAASSASGVPLTVGQYGGAFEHSWDGAGKAIGIGGKSPPAFAVPDLLSHYPAVGEDVPAGLAPSTEEDKVGRGGGISVLKRAATGFVHGLGVHAWAYTSNSVSNGSPHVDETGGAFGGGDEKRANLFKTEEKVQLVEADTSGGNHGLGKEEVRSGTTGGPDDSKMLGEALTVGEADEKKIGVAGPKPTLNYEKHGGAEAAVLVKKKAGAEVVAGADKAEEPAKFVVGVEDEEESFSKSEDEVTVSSINDAEMVDEKGGAESQHSAGVGPKPREGSKAPRAAKAKAKAKANTNMAPLKKFKMSKGPVGADAAPAKDDAQAENNGPGASVVAKAPLKVEQAKMDELAAVAAGPAKMKMKTEDWAAAHGSDEEAERKEKAAEGEDRASATGSDGEAAATETATPKAANEEGSEDHGDKKKSAAKKPVGDAGEDKKDEGGDGEKKDGDVAKSEAAPPKVEKTVDKLAAAGPAQIQMKTSKGVAAPGSDEAADRKEQAAGGEDEASATRGDGEAAATKTAMPKAANEEGADEHEDKKKLAMKTPVGDAGEGEKEDGYIAKSEAEDGGCSDGHGDHEKHAVKKEVAQSIEEKEKEGIDGSEDSPKAPAVVPEVNRVPEEKEKIEEGVQSDAAADSGMVASPEQAHDDLAASPVAVNAKAASALLSSESSHKKNEGEHTPGLQQVASPAEPSESAEPGKAAAPVVEDVAVVEQQPLPSPESGDQAGDAKSHDAAQGGRFASGPTLSMSPADPVKTQGQLLPFPETEADANAGPAPVGGRASVHGHSVDLDADEDEDEDQFWESLTARSGSSELSENEEGPSRLVHAPRNPSKEPLKLLHPSAVEFAALAKASRSVEEKNRKEEEEDVDDFFRRFRTSSSGGSAAGADAHEDSTAAAEGEGEGEDGTETHGSGAMDGRQPQPRPRQDRAAQPQTQSQETQSQERLDGDTSPVEMLAGSDSDRKPGPTDIVHKPAAAALQERGLPYTSDAAAALFPIQGSAGAGDDVHQLVLGRLQSPRQRQSQSQSRRRRLADESDPFDQLPSPPLPLADWTGLPAEADASGEDTARLLQSSSDMLTLTTTFVATDGAAGNAFKVKALVDLTIYGFDVHLLPGSQNVQVWTRSDGSYDFLNSAEWTKIYDSTVTGAGEGNPTVLGNFDSPITIPADAEQSFHVWTSVTPGIGFTTGTSAGSVYDSVQGVLEFYEGLGCTGLWSCPLSPFVWNGNIHYKLGVPIGWPCSSDINCNDGITCNGEETCDPLTSTCLPGEPVGGGSRTITITINTDFNSNKDTSWDLKDPDGNILLQGDDDGMATATAHTYLIDVCPSAGSYEFTFHDSYYATEHPYFDDSYELKLDGEMILSGDGGPSTESFQVPFVTLEPTLSPSPRPSEEPSSDPSSSPSMEPTSSPTRAPSLDPTGSPTASPTSYPTSSPSTAPSSDPTGSPLAQAETDVTKELDVSIGLSNASCPISPNDTEKLADDTFCAAASTNCAVVDVTVSHGCSSDSRRNLAEAGTTTVTINATVVFTIQCEGGCGEGDLAEVQQLYDEAAAGLTNTAVILERIQQSAQEQSMASFEFVAVEFVDVLAAETDVTESTEETTPTSGLPSETSLNFTNVQVREESGELIVTYERSKGWSYTTVSVITLDEEGDGGIGECDPNKAVDQSALLPFVTWTNPPNTGDDVIGHPDRDSVSVTFKLDMGKLPASPFWFSRGNSNSTGKIALCARADMWLNVTGADPVSVAFHTHSLVLDVDISNATLTLEASAVAANVSLSSSDLKNIYNVTAYICKEGEGADTYEESSSAPLAVLQGEPFYVCISPMPDVRVASLTLSKVENQRGEDMTDYLGVEDNKPKSLFVKEVGAKKVGGAIVEKWSFLAISQVFATRNPADTASLVMEGSARLEFFDASEGRRRLEHRRVRSEISLRGLQGNSDAGTAPLLLEVPLAATADLDDEDVEHNIFFRAGEAGGTASADQGTVTEDADAESVTKSAASAAKFLGLAGAGVLVGAVAIVF